MHISDVTDVLLLHINGIHLRKYEMEMELALIRDRRVNGRCQLVVEKDNKLECMKS